MDIFTLLSTGHEGISQASLQASWLKKPLITTTIGGLPEVCIDGVTGLLVPPASPEKVAEAVLKLANDADLRKSMGENARKLVEKNYLFDHTLNAMELMWSELSSSMFLLNLFLIMVGRMQIEEIPIGKFGFIREQTIDWFKSHLSLVATGAAILVAVLVGAGRFLGWFQGGGEVDFVSADVAYRKWDGGKETLAKLEKILKRHPELHVKYDGAIAQKLLRSSESGLAQGYANAAIKRMGSFSPHYTDFSEGIDPHCPGQT